MLVAFTGDGLIVFMLVFVWRANQLTLTDSEYGHKAKQQTLSFFYMHFCSKEKVRQETVGSDETEDSQKVSMFVIAANFASHNLQTSSPDTNTGKEA